MTTRFQSKIRHSPLYCQQFDISYCWQTVHQKCCETWNCMHDPCIRTHWLFIFFQVILLLFLNVLQWHDIQECSAQCEQCRLRDPSAINGNILTLNTLKIDWLCWPEWGKIWSRQRFSCLHDRHSYLLCSTNFSLINAYNTALTNNPATLAISSI